MLNPQERAALARRREAEAGRGRLAHGRRSGDRRARRPAGQARAAARARAARHALELERGRVPGRDLPHRAARRDARRRVRAQKKEPAGRKADYSVLRATSSSSPGLQGLKKFYVRAQAARTTRCAASPSSTTRRWKAPWTRSWSRCRAPSCRSRARRASAPPPRRKVEYGTGVVVGAGPRRHRAARRSTAATSSRSPASATPIASPRTRRAGSRCCACYGART